MPGLKVEISAFLTAFLTGMTAACGYFCIHKLRRVIRHSLAAITAEDALYWLGTAIYIFVQIFDTSSGSIRWYFVTGAILGILAFLVLCRLAAKAGDRIAGKKRKRNHEKLLK